MYTAMAKVLSHAEPKSAQGSSTEPVQEPTTRPDDQQGPVCLFSSKPDGPFEDEEHVVPKSLGNNADYRRVPWEIVIPPGEVCDPCNHKPLSKLNKALAEWPPISDPESALAGPEPSKQVARCRARHALGHREQRRRLAALCDSRDRRHQRAHGPRRRRAGDVQDRS